MVRVTQIYKVRLFLDEVRKTSSCANQKPAEEVPARGKVLGECRRHGFPSWLGAVNASSRGRMHERNLGNPQVMPRPRRSRGSTIPRGNFRYYATRRRAKVAKALSGVRSGL
jgi:hypothetical protein